MAKPRVRIGKKYFFHHGYGFGRYKFRPRNELTLLNISPEKSFLNEVSVGLNFRVYGLQAIYPDESITKVLNG